MRNIIFLCVFVSSATALGAALDPWVQECVQHEIQAQHDRYAGYTTWNFTVRSGSTPNNFAYWIRFAPPANEPSCFVEVRNRNYAEAELQFGLLKPEVTTVNLERCFTP